MPPRRRRRRRRRRCCRRLRNQLVRDAAHYLEIQNLKQKPGVEVCNSETEATRTFKS